MTTNFSHLLEVPVNSVKRPPTKPAGTYYGVVMSYKFDESKKERTPFVRFTFGNLQPGSDITPEQLRTVDGEEIDLSKWQPHTDYYLTQNALYRLREFLESLGIPIDGRSFSETIPETKNLPVILTVIQQPSTKPGDESIYNQISEVKGAK